MNAALLASQSLYILRSSRFILIFPREMGPIDSEIYHRRIHNKLARVLYRASIDVLHIELELKGGWAARAIKTVLVVLGINVSRRSKINLTLAPFPESGILTVNEN